MLLHQELSEASSSFSSLFLPPFSLSLSLLLFFYFLLVFQIKILTPDAGDYAIAVGRNVCHGSDSVENAKKEIALWFKEGEVQSYKSSQHDWIYEKP